MPRRFRPLSRCLLASVCLWTTTTFAQDAAAPPTTAPTTVPAESEVEQATPTAAPDPLLSPATMVESFLIALNESEKQPERLADAIRCLDLSALRTADPADADKQAPQLARQLREIIDALLNTYGVSRDDIPKATEEDRIVLPGGGSGIKLVVVRGGDNLWRFSPDTIAAIPAYLGALREDRVKEDIPVEETAEVEGVPLAYRSARATMMTFLEAMSRNNREVAQSCLYLEHLPANIRSQSGNEFAWGLLEIIDRIRKVVPEDLPDAPGGESYIFYEDTYGRIEIECMKEGDRKGYWLFNQATVDSLETLYPHFAEKPRVPGLPPRTFWQNPRAWILERIPAQLKPRILGLRIFQWLAIVVGLALGYLAHRISLLILFTIARPLGRSQYSELMPKFIRSCLRPISMLIMLATWWGIMRLLVLKPSFLQFAWPVMRLVVTALSVWACYRLIDLISDFFSARASRTNSRLDDVLVPLVRKTTKIVVVIVGAIFIFEAVGVEQTTLNKLFAGVGLGGLAFALAARETIANFFGSVTVILDRPFHVGDWVKVGDSEGTVEEVGLRSSRLRTFHNSQIIIPNADLMTATVDNMGRRKYRRISCKLSVLYSTTPEQLEAFCEGIRELIRRHPFTRKDFYLVFVNEFAASSIDVLLYCFHETPDWVTELRERHRLFLDIVRLARRLDVRFAYPTQTIHLVNETATSDSSKPPVDVVAHSEQTAPDARAAGRSAAAEIAAESLKKADDVTPRFEFPPAE